MVNQLQQQNEGGAAAMDRPLLLFVTLGDTGLHIVHGTGMFELIAAGRKWFIAFNTNDLMDAIPLHLRDLGRVERIRIPSWVTVRAVAGTVDPHAPKRPLVLRGATFRARPEGADNRAEGALAAIERCATVFNDLRAGIAAVAPQRAAVQGTPARVTMIITLFIGRGTGSGSLPVLLAMIPQLRDDFAGQVDLKVAVVAQLPTVHEDRIEMFRRRTVQAVAEVTALVETAVQTDPQRTAGLWLPPSSPPWNDFVVLGMAGAGQHERGIQTDINEAARFAAALIEQRYAGAFANALATAPNRPELNELDPGTMLPRCFSAGGLAELVYEPEPAAQHASAYIEREFYDALREEFND